MYPFKAERARKPANYQTHNRRYKKLVNGGRGQTLTVLSDEEKILMQAVKDMGQNLIDIFDDIGQSRELSIAKTKMEEAVMWACKHITA